MLRKRALLLSTSCIHLTLPQSRLLPLLAFGFSQKKLGKIIVSPEDYLKDTSFDTDLKAEWSQKESEFKTFKDSQSDFRKKVLQELEETREEFKETDSILRSFKRKLRLEEASNLSQAEKLESEEFLEFTRMHFEGQDHEEIKLRSKKFKDHLRLNQDWSPLKHFDPHISDQYASYTHYQKSFPKFRDVSRTYEQDFSELQKKNQEELEKKLDPRLLAKRQLPMKKSLPEALNPLEELTKKNEEQEQEAITKRKIMFTGAEGELPPLSSELIREKVHKPTLKNSEQIPIDEFEKEELLEDYPVDKLPKDLLLEAGASESKERSDEEIMQSEGEEAAENKEKSKKKSKGKEAAYESDDEHYEEHSSDYANDEEVGSKDRNFGFSKEERVPLTAKELFSSKSSGFMDPLIDEYDQSVQRVKHSLFDEEEEDEDIYNPFGEEEENLDEESLIEPKTEIMYGRVSPWAKEEIFRLFLQGWAVRDLSLRYGILPERVKAIVWMRKQFYNEIFHHLNIKTIRLGLEAEILYGMSFPWVDYGLDIQELVERERGVPLMNFQGASRTVDTKAWEDKERNTKRFRELLQQKTKKKFDQVIEGFVGKGSSGYLLKSWMVYKGHGSERVNRGFKRAVHDSERRHRLSCNMQKKVRKGPRYVAMGQGVK